jgi:hypothetical protein
MDEMAKGRRSSNSPRIRQAPASQFRRASREESAKLGVEYSAKVRVPVWVGRVTSRTATISESAYREKKEGVKKEQAIEQRRRGEREYAETGRGGREANRIRGQRAITRNRTNPIRAHVRAKKEKGERVTERDFTRNNARFLDLIAQKSGKRWSLVNGTWEAEDTGAAPRFLSDEEFDFVNAHYRANGGDEGFYGAMREDLFTNWSGVASPPTSKKLTPAQRARRAERRRHARGRRAA